MKLSILSELCDLSSTGQSAEPNNSEAKWWYASDSESYACTAAGDKDRICHEQRITVRSSVTELSLSYSHLIGAADLNVDLDINSVVESVEAVRVILVIYDNPRICPTWAGAAVGPSFPRVQQASHSIRRTILCSALPRSAVRFAAPCFGDYTSLYCLPQQHCLMQLRHYMILELLQVSKTG